MSFAAQAYEIEKNPVRMIDGPETLGAFLEPGCAAAIWRRQTPQDVQSWLDALDPARLPRGRVITPAGVVGPALAQMGGIYGVPDCAERAWLTDDVVALARGFSQLMSADYLRLRMDVVTTNACRRFHIDAITARLVCTYRGTGTQYGVSVDGAQPEEITTVKTGVPILLRGTAWRGQASAPGFLHRSPPIEGTGETRLVLVLDPVTHPEGEDEGLMALHSGHTFH